jgi:anti-sigma factor RsiW
VTSSDTDRALNEREAMTMAYVDDELPSDERRRFESLLAEDRELAAEVADYQVMLDLGRAAARQEPTDHEMRRFWARLYNKVEWRIGWLLLGAGAAILFVLGVYELCLVTDLPWLVKGALLSMLAGGGLLLASTVRQRVRTTRFDRYRGVQR